MKFEIKPSLVKIFHKLSKKDKVIYNIVLIKIDKIINSNKYTITNYKNLKYNYNNFKRVHIGSFVLLFHFDEDKEIIFFEDFQYHDKIYL